MGMDHISMLQGIDFTGDTTQERVALPFKKKRDGAGAPDGSRSYADVVRGAA